MPAYVLVELSIHNKELYEEYKLLTPETIQAYGGRFVVRGGEIELLEGDWYPERIVLLEFPTAQWAREWWESEEYTHARGIRQRAAETRMIILQGI